MPGGGQRPPTFSLLAELPVMLAQLQHQLGAEKFHLRVRGQHLRWGSLLHDSIGLDIQVPVHPAAATHSQETSQGAEPSMGTDKAPSPMCSSSRAGTH